MVEIAYTLLHTEVFGRSFNSSKAFLIRELFSSQSLDKEDKKVIRILSASGR